MAVDGNQYDGQMQSVTLKQAERIAQKPKYDFVDMGHYGHGHNKKDVNVHVDTRRRG